MKNSKLAGFTLIEIIMVTVLLGIIGMVVTRMYGQALVTARTEQVVTESIWQGQVAIQRMVRDIRQIRSRSSITNLTASQLTFTDIAGNSVDYQLSGTTLLRNSTALADGISTLSFSYLTQAGASGATSTNVSYITISLQVNQNNITYPLSTSVYLRDIYS